MYLAEKYARGRYFSRNEDKRQFIERKTQSLPFSLFKTCDFCVTQGIIDLQAVPFIILTMFVAPWRIIFFYKTVYRYGEAKNVATEIGLGRQEVLKQVALGLKDWRAYVQILILVMFPLRLPFLIAILKKNVFRPENELNHLHFHKCVNITFKELCIDIIYLPFAILSIFLAPWRVITLYGIIRNQTQRVPSWENYKEIRSKKHEFYALFVRVLTFDISCAFMTLGLVLTVYKIRRVFKIYNACLKVIFSDSDSDKVNCFSPLNDSLIFH